jgi:hypothetical protein
VLIANSFFLSVLKCALCGVYHAMHKISKVAKAKVLFFSPDDKLSFAIAVHPYLPCIDTTWRAKRAEA